MSLIDDIELSNRISVDDVERWLDVFRKYQFYFYVGVLFIITAQLFMSVVLPSIQEYRLESKSLRQYEEILKHKQSQAADKENVQVELDRLHDVLNQKKRLFFDKDSIEEFALTELPRLAREYGVSFQAIQFKKARKEDNQVTAHPVHVQYTALFDNMMAFFYALEHYSKAVTIETFDMKVRTKENAELSSSMVLTLYSLELP